MRWWMKTESAQVSGTKVRVRPATRSAVALEQESFNYCTITCSPTFLYIPSLLIESYVFETEREFSTFMQKLHCQIHIVGRVEPDFIPANYP